jgi:poly(A) polymerase
LSHPRFRAGYDFFLLRCEAGEQPMHLGALWTDMHAVETREQAAALLDEYMLTHSDTIEKAPAKKRRRRVAKPAAAEPQ